MGARQSRVRIAGLVAAALSMSSFGLYFAGSQMKASVHRTIQRVGRAAEFQGKSAEFARSALRLLCDRAKR